MKRLLIIFSFLCCFTLTTVVSAEKRDLREEVIYNILVDRFNNGDQTHSEDVRIDDPYAYHGGDIKGIIAKLDDLESLGFTTITLSPVMENAKDGYHGYWIEDFYNVEKQFGTMEDLQTLVNEAHQRDMKVILEFVTNYVSETHPYVLDEEKEDWFKDVNKPNHLPDSMYWLDEVAFFNHENEDVQTYLLDVANYWIEETDVDGFKLHAADQASQEFLNHFTSTLKEKNPHFYIIADVLDSTADLESLRNNTYIDAVDNEKMHDALNEVFTQARSPVSKLYETWKENGNNNDLLFVDSKDTPRFAYNASRNDRNALTTWKLALTYLYTSPGIPSFYQGSELKMYEPGFPENQQMVKFNSTDPDLEEFIHRISSLRDQFPALVYGDFKQVATNDALSVFKRSLEDEEIYIAINNGDEMEEVTLSEIPESKQLRGLLGDNIIRKDKNGEFSLSIPREDVEIYVIEDNIGINWLFISLIGSVFIIFVWFVIYVSRKQKNQ